MAADLLSRTPSGTSHASDILSQLARPGELDLMEGSTLAGQEIKGPWRSSSAL